jgi:hypothetical protein
MVRREATKEMKMVEEDRISEHLSRTLVDRSSSRVMSSL